MDVGICTQEGGKTSQSKSQCTTYSQPYSQPFLFYVMYVYVQMSP